MHITLKVDGEILGTADWHVVPAKDDVITLRKSTNGSTEVRRVDALEDNPSGGKIVHLGAVQPIFVYSR
jgi:hypothetical protein